MFLSIFRRATRPSHPHFRRLCTNNTGPIIGIDLGTTNSCVAVLKDEDVVVLENEGKRTTPSIFAIDKNGNRLVGSSAQRQMVVNPKNTFFATKRLIGRRFDDKEISELAKQVPFSIVPSPNGDAWVSDEAGIKYSPEQIASNILLKLKQVAENFLGCDVHRAVITVPAYFDNHQRQATEAAGKIAGLKVERIINEPTAAALAYGISRDDNKLIAVYDLGGGTFDISILEIGNGLFEVKSTAGDTFLGGEDFNSLLGNYLIKTFQKQQNIDLSKDKVALQRVREAAENAKHDLSVRDSVKVNLPFIHVDSKGSPKSLDITITRSLFESLSEDLIKKSIVPCKKALSDAGLKVEDISDVILVGGMTRMPKVREYVKKFFNKEPFAGVNPDEAVAVGAALQGSIIENKGLIPGSGDKEIILLDVTPLNLGTSIHSGEMVVIIPAQTPIPCTKTSTFTTYYDYQTQIQTQVYQGNRPIAKDNRLLGEYTVTGIPAAPSGVPKIDVTFTCSANGTITATSQDRATKIVQGTTLNMAGGLSGSEIERMRKEALQFTEVDKKKQNFIHSQERARKFLTTTETAIKGFDTSIVKTLKSEIDVVQLKMSELQNIINNAKSVEEIEGKLKPLENLTNKLLTTSYNMSVK